MVGDMASLEEWLGKTSIASPLVSQISKLREKTDQRVAIRLTISDKLIPAPPLSLRVAATQQFDDHAGAGADFSVGTTVLEYVIRSDEHRTY